MNKKVLLIIGASLVVLLVVVVGAIALSLNTAIKVGIETLGPKIAGVPITVKKVKLSPLSGKGSLHGLVVGNPKGFETPSAFRLKKVLVKVEISSLLSDTIVIKKIHIDAPEITYEWKMSGSNIAKIQENIAGDGTAPEGDAKEAPEEAGPGKKVILDDFQLRNAKVAVTASMLKGVAPTLPVPDVHLTEIGRKSGGATVSEVVAEIFAQITDVVASAAKSSGNALGSDAVKDTAENLLKGVGGLFKRDK